MKNYWNCTIENDTTILTKGDKKEEFTNGNIATFTKFVLDNKIDKVIVKLEAYEKACWLELKHFKSLNYNELPVEEYCVSKLSDIFSIKIAYAFACIFARKHLEVNEAIAQHVIKLTFISSVNKDGRIHLLNQDYDTVIDKKIYNSHEYEYINEIINAMSVKDEYYDYMKIQKLVRNELKIIDIESVAYYTIERNIELSNNIKELANKKTSIKLECNCDSDCDESQKKAQINICESDNVLNILQAWPGSGKTFIIERLIADNPGKIAAVAHFNAATKNLAARIKKGYSIPGRKRTKDGVVDVEICEPKTICSTYYGLLNGDILLDNIEMLIVDESSVISYVEFAMIYYILSRCNEDCKLLMVGDINQCSPVCNRGVALLEMLNLLDDNYINILNESHRMSPAMQKIIANANNGMVFEVESNNDDIELYDGNIDVVCKYALSNYSKIEHTGDFGCIAFTNDNCNKINDYIDDYYLNKLNKHRIEPEFKNDKKESPDYIGRRIKSNENAPKLGISKSDIFTIKDINLKTLKIESLEGRELTIERKYAPRFAPAWAVTVHSYQGREVDHMAICFSSDIAFKEKNNSYMNIFHSNRNNYVVGLSRGKKKLTAIDLHNTTQENLIPAKSKKFYLQNHRDVLSPNGIFAFEAF